MEGGGGEERRAYTWLRERESGERVKASEEGAGMMMMMWNGMDGDTQGSGSGGKGSREKGLETTGERERK